MASWLEEKYGDAARDAGRVQIEDFGELPLAGEVAVWHPLDDLYAAPRLALDSPPRVRAISVGDELAGYVLGLSGEAATWRELGDASTDTDRFFLVQVDQSERVIDWLNEDPSGFEALGGDDAVQPVLREDGARVVVIASPDGNARIRAGYTDLGRLAVVVIDVS